MFVYLRLHLSILKRICVLSTLFGWTNPHFNLEITIYTKPSMVGPHKIRLCDDACRKRKMKRSSSSSSCSTVFFLSDSISIYRCMYESPSFHILLRSYSISLFDVYLSVWLAKNSITRKHTVPMSSLLLILLLMLLLLLCAYSMFWVVVPFLCSNGRSVSLSLSSSFLSHSYSLSVSVLILCLHLLCVCVNIYLNWRNINVALYYLQHFISIDTID